MIRNRFIQSVEGEPIIVGKTWRIRCCDCGLIHRFEFTVKKGEPLTVRPYREQRATASSRRSRRYKQKLRDLARKYAR